jgi:6-phosphogluconolactonase
MSKPWGTPLNSAKWTHEVAEVVMNAVTRAYKARGEFSVMITGGRSAECLYKTWAAMPDFAGLTNIRFFFGDERCLPPNHPESNYGLAMRTLFRHGIPKTCEVMRMSAELPDPEVAAATYEALLPERIDVLLLSMGEDGHIASLFPQSLSLFETRRRVVHVIAPKPPFGRLTVTPSVITQAHQVFVISIGKVKARVYRRAQLAPQDIAEIPARLVLNANWFLG